MNINFITEEQKQKLGEIKDLTLDSNHAIGIAMNGIISALEKKYSLSADIHRGSHIVSRDNNFYKLGYDDSEVTLGGCYTKYVDEHNVFRTQMTSVIPGTLEDLSKDSSWREKLIVCPGMVFRRDVVDKTHVGQPHQMDVWRLIKDKQLNRQDLLELVDVIVDEMSMLLKEKIKWKYNETSHHYTEDGIEVEIYYRGKLLEILECGLAGRKLLANSGIPSNYSGLALGMGLDRFVMIVKDIEDIRILRDSDPKIRAQMQDLSKFKPVSKQPCIKRDLSLAIPKNMTIEDLTEEAMCYMGDRVSIVEEFKLVSVNDGRLLPEMVTAKLGLDPDKHDNWLVRLTMRHVSQSLTSEEADSVYKMLYKLLHRGSVGYF